MRVSYLAMVGLLWGCQRPAPPTPPPAASSPPLEQASPAPEPPAEPLAQTEPPDAPPKPDAPGSTEENKRLSLGQADDGPEPTWIAVSADGSAEVRQRPLARGKGAGCVTTATAIVAQEPRRVVWEWETCIATREQLVFVSSDGQRVLVLDPTAAPVAHKHEGAGSPERVTLYEQGLRTKFLRAESAPRGVKGTAGLPGTPPRYSADGAALEFETGEGHAFRLGFDGTGFPPATEEARPFLESEDLYRYTDARGAVRVVNSVDEIPEHDRPRASRVKAHLSIEPASPPRAAASATAEPAKPPAPNAGPVPPSELVDKARKTVEQVQEIQREQKRVLDSLR